MSLRFGFFPFFCVLLRLAVDTCFRSHRSFVRADRLSSSRSIIALSEMSAVELSTLPPAFLFA